MKIFSHRRVIICLLAGCLAAFSFSGPALAATGLTIQPVKISETLKPEESFSGSIHLISASDGDPIQVEASVEDFIPVAGAESIQFVGRAPGVTTVRDWIDLGGKKIFDLKQGEFVDIPYTITAPGNAEPGSHLGVIFFKATRPSITGQTFNIGARIGMLVLITVPGSHLQKGRILAFTGPSFIQQPPATFKIKFENTGTVHFEPKGTMTMINMLGQKVGTVPIEGQIVLPTSIKDITIPWNVHGWFMGRYSATAILYDGEGTAMTTGVLSFWVVPVWYILATSSILLVTFLIIRWIKRRVRISLVK